MNEAFVRELARLRPDPAVQTVWELFIRDVHLGDTSARNKEVNSLRAEQENLQGYKERLRKLLIEGTLPPDDYKIEKDRADEKLARIAYRLEASADNSDIERDLRYAMNLLANIDQEYSRADVERKRELIGSMFPEKLQFFESGVRTTRINEVAALILNVGAGLQEMKKPELANNLQSPGLLSY